MRSMTGFGQGSAENGRLRVQVTLRTVNHRYLDLSLRLRDDLRPSERRLRDVITGHLERGRVELSLGIEALAEQPVRLAVHQGAIEGLQQLQRSLVESGVVERGLSFSDILRTPEAVRLEVGGLEWQDSDVDLLIDATETALEQVVEGRSLEGDQLRAVLLQRVDKLAIARDAMSERADCMPTRLRDALRQRIERSLNDLLIEDSAAGSPVAESSRSETAGSTTHSNGQVLDDGRLAQEVALLVDRSDISEELDRLASHLKHFREVVDQQGSIGKRLDFLSQEIFRELNTIGSKCRDSDLVKLVLDSKVLCEQLREQIQNVE